MSALRLNFANNFTYLLNPKIKQKKKGKEKKKGLVCASVLVALAVGKHLPDVFVLCCSRLAVCVRAMRAMEEVLRTMKEPYRSTGV